MQSTVESTKENTLRTLPGDDVRQIMWRFADRFDVQMLVQSTRAVARGPVAHMVANGARNTHEWTKEKNEMLKAYDEAGITSAFMNLSEGGYLEGPKNLPLSLVAFELAWVDAGAATCSLAGGLALAPIRERGTAEQQQHYMSLCVPPQPGEDRIHLRGAFALTEPIPYVGVETGLLSGKVRIAEWPEGGEPLLQVDKRGRFITNMGFANFVTAAVDSADERIKGSCMVILEETDPGLYDRGSVTKKMVHQLSSTSDPVFSLKVPASRIVGGYTVKDGVIIPKYNHGEVIEAVFKRTRVGVGLMTSAKLLSAVEPVLRYQRGRFRGGEAVAPGSPRYEMGIQQREDALHRLVDVWAAGEAGASLGFATARIFDVLEPLERHKDAIFAEQGVGGGSAQMKALRRYQKEALDALHQGQTPENPIVQYVIVDAVAGVLCPACKLWNTGHGSNMMREAVSLMGGYGITEDCPGFLGQKWMDSQLEATYEGPEAVQRRQLSVTMTSELFLAQFHQWIAEMRGIAATHPGTGACALATAMQLWLWTLNHLQKATDADGSRLYMNSRQGVTFPLADALCWVLAARQQILDVLQLETHGPDNPSLAEALPGMVRFFSNLCHVQVARASGESARVCAELVYGYNRHPAWDEEGIRKCYSTDDLVVFEAMIPGISSGATDVVGADGSHPVKAGPCAQVAGLEQFSRLRSKLDSCLTGSRIAKDRAAEALTQVMIPEALDY
jgi:alkylation response protein AidB-like acyl-CoA dehydrogenase